MKKQLPKLFDLISDLRESFYSCRFLNKQLIVDTAEKHYDKLLNSKAVIEVTMILKEDYNEFYTLDENIQYAIYDYLNQ